MRGEDVEWGGESSGDRKGEKNGARVGEAHGRGVYDCRDEMGARR